MKPYRTVGDVLDAGLEDETADEVLPKYRDIVEELNPGQRYCSARHSDRYVPVWDLRDFSEEETEALRFLARHRRRVDYQVDESRDADYIESSDIPVDESVLSKLCEEGWLRREDTGVYESAYDLTSKSGVYSRFRRLRPDAPSWTLTTQSFQSRNIIHPSDPRSISLAEGAAIQSFPEDFEFRGSVRETRNQIGNAVPPRLARHLAEVMR